MDRWLRHAAPLVLVALAGLVWLEPWIPGSAWFAENFGATAVLRFVIGCGCIYLALLIMERQQMGAMFRQVLEQLRNFRAEREAAAAGGMPRARADAVRILIAALASDDAEVQANAHDHLVRLTGQDLGVDPAAWRAWAAEQLPDAPSAQIGAD